MEAIEFFDGEPASRLLLMPPASQSRNGGHRVLRWRALLADLVVGTVPVAAMEAIEFFDGESCGSGQRQCRQ